MAPKRSAGLLLCRPSPGWPNTSPEFLLVHPGGPLFAHKDAGSWTIPKGLIEAGEDPEATARREFGEETGFTVPAGPLMPIGSITQKGGKQVWAWMAIGDADPRALNSNLFELEWPPRSGIRQRFPEVDRAQWFDFTTASAKIIAAQLPLLERARALLGGAPG